MALLVQPVEVVPPRGVRRVPREVLEPVQSDPRGGGGRTPSRARAAEGPGADAEPPGAPIAASNAAPVFRTRGEEGGQGARRDRARGRYLSASAPARRVRRTVPTAARRRARGARRWRERATGARARVPVPPRRVRGESGRCHLERSAGKIARARGRPAPDLMSKLGGQQLERSHIRRREVHTLRENRIRTPRESNPSEARARIGHARALGRARTRPVHTWRMSPRFDPGATCASRA